MESDIYHKLYELSKKKRDVIIEDEIDSLEAITEQEEKYIEQLHELEEQREKVADGKTMSELAAEAEGKNKNKLNDLQDELSALVEQLKEQNEFNNRLIKDSLQLVNLNLNLLTDENNQSMYGDKGDVVESDNRKSIINQKA